MIRQLAYSANGNMIGVAAMAGFTIASNTCMNALCILERSRAAANGCISVADRTILICRQVIKCLAGTDITVMARYAVTRDSSMIKCCRYKARGFMAGTAITIGWQVINKFTNSDHIVMTICTKCLRVNVTWAMTKDAASESAGGMASSTILGWV